MGGFVSDDTLAIGDNGQVLTQVRRYPPDATQVSHTIHESVCVS